MRSFLILTAVTVGVLLAVDAYKFGGRYRDEAWRDVKQHGRSFASNAEYAVRRAFNR